MEPVELRTERLVLDTPLPEDRARVTEYCQDPVFPGYMTLPWPYTSDDAVFFLESLVPDGWRTEREFTWALREASDGPLLGVVGMRVQPEPRTLDIGYWLGAPHRGHGYMAEAARAAVAWAFDSLEVDTVLWECVVGNLASVGVARAAGFSYTGAAPLKVEVSSGGHPDAWHGARRRGAGPDAPPWPAEVLEHRA